jgi:hypothetical protein
VRAWSAVEQPGAALPRLCAGASILPERAAHTTDIVAQEASYQRPARALRRSLLRSALGVRWIAVGVFFVAVAEAVAVAINADALP